MSRDMLWTLVFISFISLVELTKISSVLEPTRRNVPLKNQLKTRKTVATRLGLDGNPVQECECVKADLCNRDNVIQYSTTGERINCGKNSVCCINSLSKESSSPLAQLKANSGKETENLNASCDCIPCLIQQLLATDDELNNFSLSDCEAQNECCSGFTELPPLQTLDPKPTLQNADTKNTLQNLDPKPTSQNLDPEPPSQNLDPEPPLQNLDPQFPSQNLDPQLPSQNLDPEPTSQNIDPEPTSQNLDPQPPSQNLDPQTPSQNLYPQPPSQNLYPQPPFQSFNPEPTPTSQNLNPKPTSQNLYPKPIIDPLPFAPEQSSNSFKCGIRRPGFSYYSYTSPMKGHWETTFGEFPWMALLLTSLTAPDGTTTDNIFVCGASIISPSTILTAAHCVSEVNIANLKVRAGEFNALDDILELAPHQDREVSNIRIHPNYDSKLLFNDLALLTLIEPFNFTDHIYPICTALIDNQWASATYDTKSCITTGWGRSTFGNKRVIYSHELLANYMVSDDIYHTTLRKVDQCIIPRDYCENYFRDTQPGSYFKLDRSFICAVGQFGNNICEGDGGGPLVCPLKDNPSRYVQVGVVSWGTGCGNGLPSVYASLEANMEWLSQEYANLTAQSIFNL